ncbi:MAG: hypothetical protein AB1491_09315 [Thermodesulfobacteriota bacterium]
MALREDLKINRALSRKKKPLRPSLFAQVIQVVQEYALGDDFLKKLDHPGLEPTGPPFPLDSLPPKPVRAPRPFPLASEAEYNLAQAIISKVNNPYLFYASRPEEILLCPSLYRLNPGFGAETLERCHFALLLAYASAQQELQDLGAPEAVAADPEEPGGEAGIISRRARLAELRQLVERVEKHHFKAGK